MKYGRQEKTGNCFWRESEVKRNAESNLEFRGVQPKPRQFTPIINFGTPDSGMGTFIPNDRAVIADTGKGIGQPIGEIFITTRPLKGN